jgi:hypothetical protein
MAAADFFAVEALSRVGLIRYVVFFVIEVPPQSPDLDAFAERFVLSIKSECLNRLVILGERHLRRAIAEYLEHCHDERTHQGLGNQLIAGVPELASGRVVRRERLGRLLNHYDREAA